MDNAKLIRVLSRRPSWPALCDMLSPYGAIEGHNGGRYLELDVDGVVMRILDGAHNVYVVV